ALIDAVLADIDLLVGARRDETAIIIVVGCNADLRSADRDDAGDALERIDDGFPERPQLCTRQFIDLDDVITFVPRVDRAGVDRLAVDDSGADDEPDRNRELQD